MAPVDDKFSVSCREVYDPMLNRYSGPAFADDVEKPSNTQWPAHNSLARSKFGASVKRAQDDFAEPSRELSGLTSRSKNLSRTTT